MVVLLNGVSVFSSPDLRTWTYAGHTDAGENACVLVENGEYVLVHSPKNGIAFKRSPDLRTWRDWGPLVTLGQADWPWARGHERPAPCSTCGRTRALASTSCFFTARAR